MTSVLDYDEITSEFLTDDPDSIDPEFLEGETLKDTDPEFVEEIKETARAKRYRLKVKKGLNFLMRLTVDKPNTVADAAAIIEYGPQVSKAIGKLADSDERVRKIIDFVTDDGIENPYVTTIIATIPLFFQVIRNHEQALNREVKPHLRIPFTKRSFKLPFKFRFNFSFVRKSTAPPELLIDHVFGNPTVRELLAKQDLKIAWNPNYNGHRK